VKVNELSCILFELSGIPEQLSLSQKVVSGSGESRQKVRAERKKVSFGIQSRLAAEPLKVLKFFLSVSMHDSQFLSALFSTLYRTLLDKR
jgi:hypothetical protein